MKRFKKCLALALAALTLSLTILTGDIISPGEVYAKTSATATTLKSISQKNYTIIVKWNKKSSHVSGYQVQYATDSKFSQGRKTLTFKSKKTVKTTIKKLSTDTTYYVRIRTYYKKNGKTYRSAWSKAKSLYMKPYSARWSKLLAKYKDDDTVNQLAFVQYTGGSDCIVVYYEKKDGKWVKAFKTKGYVGKNGINKKKQGDKKTPTGTYNLTTPFGIKADPGSALSYLKVTKYHYWSSDPDYYNQLVDVRDLGLDSIRGEHLINFKGCYNYCMFIDYNKEGTVGKGCQIFFHCIGKKDYTAGCVAIPEKYMKYVVQTADSAKICIYQRYENYTK